jgi:ATP-binding cassette subfamily F protein 3
LTLTRLDSTRLDSTRLDSTRLDLAGLETLRDDGLTTTQDPVLDMTRSALQTVLGFDLEGKVLRRRLAELKAAEATAAAEPEPSADLPAEERLKLSKVNEKTRARIQKRVADTEALLAEVGTDTADARAAAILTGLQFTREMIECPLGSLSGGWRMRATLAAALFVPADVLLLDEPTKYVARSTHARVCAAASHGPSSRPDCRSHLDFPALLWLSQWLQGCPSTCLIVSHDRGFLDDVHGRHSN